MKKYVTLLLISLFALTIGAIAQSCYNCASIGNEYYCVLANEGGATCHLIHYQGSLLCIQSGYCNTCNPTPDGCIAVRPVDVKAGDDAGFSNTPHCSKLDLPMTPKLSKLYPWVLSTDFAALISRESSFPETPVVFAQIANYTKENGLPTLLGISFKDVSVAVKLQEDKSYLLSFYADPKREGVTALQKRFELPTEILRVIGHSYTHTVNGTVFKGTF